MLALPDKLTQAEATGCLQGLSAAMQRQTDPAVVVDATALQEFDSAALAVLLQLRRQCLAGGRGFSVRAMPARLANLATLYGIEGLLPQV